MIRAACHCTAVRFEIAAAPEWVLDCNCTICRRHGALWTYPKADEAKLLQGETDTYVWGDREIALHRCKVCGCVTHMELIAAKKILGINARLIPTLDPARVRIRQKDNGHTGRFWTRSDAPPEASNHPKMDLPKDEDWR